MADCFLTIIVALTLRAGPAGEWARFRGPNGSGVAETGALPAEFGPTRNVIWKTDLPQGYSSPVVFGNRIYLTGFRAGQLLSFALDRATGKVLWERQAPRDRREKLDQRNHPASPSAATDGERVYFFFADYGLLAYDVNGKELWRRPLGPFNNIYGMGASPILVDDVVVLNCDQSTGSFIAAFDQKTGRERWRTPRVEARSGHSTPVIYTPPGGRAQIVVPGSFLLSAYDPRDGKRLWWVGGLSFELKTTPDISGDTLYINGFGSPENQPGAKIDLAVAQVTASAQSNLRQLPPGTQPPFMTSNVSREVSGLSAALPLGRASNASLDFLPRQRGRRATRASVDVSAEDPLGDSKEIRCANSRESV